MEPNMLVKESSLYLLQHAHNPVRWHPWNEYALNKAKEENKPIFLSIGYSACHWCHVMAHESFENEDIAKIMNENFVNIKVDREERPDIDDVYQKVCQLATGTGGWPLSVFLTPDQRPFYVGTYFPPLDSYGRPGFGSVLRQLAQAWKEKPSDIDAAAENFVNKLKITESTPTRSKLEKSVLDEAAVNLLSLGDPVNGGFGQAPKFPNAANLSFMLRYYKISGIEKFKEFVLKTIKKMANGGMYDQVGGGFHRYSTDSRWLVPHFEKMLYDNALLPVVYAEAFQITRDERYLDVIRHTLRYVMREMTSPDGGFYSSQDADSEGEEGKYYVWKKDEVRKLLQNDFELFCLYYDITEGGNFEGKNILHNSIGVSSLSNYGKSEKEIKEIIESGKKILLEARLKRVAPGKDKKILTSWNSIMITGFLKGYRVTNDVEFLQSAEKCILFIEQNMVKDGVLLHVHNNGAAKLLGYLDDYAYFVNALLDYFEIKPMKKYLDLAEYFASYMMEHFWDENEKTFFFTADNHERLIIRTKNIYDLSMPSGNSVAAAALLRVYNITQNKKYYEASIEIMESLSTAAAENPFGFGYLLNVIYMHLANPPEIMILNELNETVCDHLKKKFLPGSMLVTVGEKDFLNQLDMLPLFAGKKFPVDRTQVYVCKDFACSLPLETVDEIEKSL